MSVFTDIQTKSQGKAQSSNWWRTQLFQALFDMGLGADGVTPGTAITFQYDPEDDNKELMKFWDKYPMVYIYGCLLYTSPSPRDRTRSRMPSSA